ncbi:hypothetical protein AOLI_G00286930 [Acnodon oligacanthus]
MLYLARGPHAALREKQLTLTSLKESPEETDNNIEEEFLSVSALIERANKNIEESQDGPTIRFGDIAVDDGLKNADQCTSGQPGCKWHRDKDRKVYVPYQIASQYGPREKSIIEDALRSFDKSTCIRFIPRTQQRDYIQIKSDRGCYSSVGRTGGEQILLCIYKHVIQHEILHALGFHHEQCRSDRDNHIRILYQNIMPVSVQASIMHLTLVLILPLLGFSPAQSRSVKEVTQEETNNGSENEDLSVTSIIERVNKNAGQAPDEPKVMFGDIATYTGFQNADPCTSRGCKWGKRRNRKVYVPYIISNQYSSQEIMVIKKALRSFERSTCIRFRPHRRQRDYIHIQSRSGCYSFVGRRGGEQVVSLNRIGCMHHGVIQHELLHALGFNHEQNRSDRDRHVQILFQNVIPGREHNFRKIRTNNLRTPYDYSSIMHYGKYAFSRNNQPTIIPIPDPNIPFEWSIRSATC